MRIIKPGLRLKSAVCSTEIMIIRAPPGEVLLCCGGREMIPLGDAPAADTQLEPAHAAGSLIGKRYVDSEERFEFLCTKGGEGSMSLNDHPLTVKQAKALPSSD